MSHEQSPERGKEEKRTGLGDHPDRHRSRGTEETTALRGKGVRLQRMQRGRREGKGEGPEGHHAIMLHGLREVEREGKKETEERERNTQRHTKNKNKMAYALALRLRFISLLRAANSRCSSLMDSFCLMRMISCS